MLTWQPRKERFGSDSSIAYLGSIEVGTVQWFRLDPGGKESSWRYVITLPGIPEEQSSGIVGSKVEAEAGLAAVVSDWIQSAGLTPADG